MGYAGGFVRLNFASFFFFNRRRAATFQCCVQYCRNELETERTGRLLTWSADS